MKSDVLQKKIANLFQHRVMLVGNFCIKSCSAK